MLSEMGRKQVAAGLLHKLKMTYLRTLLAGEKLERVHSIAKTTRLKHLQIHSSHWQLLVLEMRH